MRQSSGELGPGAIPGWENSLKKGLGSAQPFRVPWMDPLELLHPTSIHENLKTPSLSAQEKPYLQSQLHNLFLGVGVSPAPTSRDCPFQEIPIPQLSFGFFGFFFCREARNKFAFCTAWVGNQSLCRAPSGVFPREGGIPAGTWSSGIQGMDLVPQIPQEVPRSRRSHNCWNILSPELLHFPSSQGFRKERASLGMCGSVSFPFKAGIIRLGEPGILLGSSSHLPRVLWDIPEPLFPGKFPPGDHPLIQGSLKPPPGNSPLDPGKTEAFPRN